jgi:hypothetical protein
MFRKLPFEPTGNEHKQFAVFSANLLKIRFDVFLISLSGGRLEILFHLLMLRCMCSV